MQANVQPIFVVLVFVGAGLGGVLRHVLNLAIGQARGRGFPWATVFINITGSFVMGVLVGWLAFRAGAGWTQPRALFVATGVLGGYTTFSTFSLETVLLIERNQIGAGARLCRRLGRRSASSGCGRGLALVRSLA